jgi:hypothetical protein
MWQNYSRKKSYSTGLRVENQCQLIVSYGIVREFTTLSCSCKFHSMKESFLQQKLKLEERQNVVDNSISQLLSSSRRKTAQLKVENLAQTTLDVSQ